MEKEFSQKNLKNKRIQTAISLGAEMFLQHGIEEVKMTDIAEKSGVGVATLYRYFGTKSGLVTASMTFLWNDIRGLFSGVFESEGFLAQSGIKQLRDLMRMYVVLYTAHKNFMRLLAEYDRFAANEIIEPEQMAEYERSIIDFYPLLNNAYKKGIQDGTVREGIDFSLFYLTYAHALMELCKKFVSGEVLESDDFSNGEKELEMLIDTAVYYLKNHPNN